MTRLRSETPACIIRFIQKHGITPPPEPTNPEEVHKRIQEAVLHCDAMKAEIEERVRRQDWYNPNTGFYDL